MEDFWHKDRSVRLLVVFKERDHEAGGGEPRAVQRMDEVGFLVFPPEADLGAACLEVGAVGDG